MTLNIYLGLPCKIEFEGFFCGKSGWGFLYSVANSMQSGKCHLSCNQNKTTLPMPHSMGYKVNQNITLVLISQLPTPQVKRKKGKAKEEKKK